MPLFIDVRTQQEFDERHLPGAVHLPVDRIQLGELGILSDLPKDTEIHLYCRSGGRAGIAKILLEQQGFTRVTNAGGIDTIAIY